MHIRGGREPISRRGWTFPIMSRLSSRRRGRWPLIAPTSRPGRASGCAVLFPPANGRRREPQLPGGPCRAGPGWLDGADEGKAALHPITCAAPSTYQRCGAGRPGLSSHTPSSLAIVGPSLAAWMARPSGAGESKQINQCGQQQRGLTGPFGRPPPPGRPAAWPPGRPLVFSRQA